MAGFFPFLPFPLPSVSDPLSRYLPLLPEGLVATWLKGSLPQGSWVLDPFGSQPRLAIEAAQAGFRLLVTCNNPIERFLLEIMARPPSLSELQAALADLSMSMKGDERIEQHIRSLYATDCANCGESIEAQAYIWDREADALHERIYHCPYCGDKGSHPISNSDVERASQFKRSGLHWFRAIERVTPMADPDRIHVEEALSTYTPRAVYGLFTLINLLDRIPKTRLRGVCALLLTAFEQSNSLWSLSSVRERPRQLRVSAQYLERNIWQALEESIGMWTKAITPAEGMSFSVWPEIPPDAGGICLFPGPLRLLVERWQLDRTADRQIRGVLAAIPHPNQAYWTLSALWAGWLWGPEATGPLKSVLRRRRYDSNWHCNALHSLFRSLSGLLEPTTPFWGSIGETEPGYLAAVLIAARTAGFMLEGIALREEVDQAQIRWISQGSTPHEHDLAQFLSPESLLAACLDNALAFLIERGEPARPMQLFTAVLAGLVKTTDLEASLPGTPAEKMTLIQDTYNQAISDHKSFTRLGASERSSETGHWWLNPKTDFSPYRQPENVLSLSDRVELAVIHFLSQNPGCDFNQVDAAVCQDFNGLSTPDQSLVEACLSSYGETPEPGYQKWYLKPQEEFTSRNTDIRIMAGLLRDIGTNLDLAVVEDWQKNQGETEQASIQWRDHQGDSIYNFYLMATAACSRIVNQPVDFTAKERGILTGRTKRDIILLPGSRAELMLYKLEHNFRLKALIESRWRLVKFRLIHRLVDQLIFDLNQLDSLFDLDPLAYQDPQMPLI